jgi:putative ABC transport system permease protein
MQGLMGEYPDLILLDGGKTHVSAVREVLKEMEIDILIPENPDVMKNFINLRKGDEIIPYTNEGAIITKKLASKTDTKIGDPITISWTEGSKTVEYQVTVADIVDNYAFHYVYMTPAYYQQVTGAVLDYNYLFCKLSEDITSEQKVQLEKEINNIKGVNGSVYTTVVIDNFANIVNTLNMVIILFIIAAMALAIVVLYNLNNINVNERIRELATLKVLGFYNGEVSAYIYRENIFLTIIGIAAGLVLGIPLNIAVVGVVDIDTLTFKTDLEPQSFIIAAVATAVFAVIVNLLMHFKLKKISMVESLKSVE